MRLYWCVLLSRSQLVVFVVVIAVCVCCDGDNAHKIFKYSCTLHKGAVDGGAVRENSKGSLSLWFSLGLGDTTLNLMVLSFRFCAS